MYNPIYIVCLTKKRLLKDERNLERRVHSKSIFLINMSIINYFVLEFIIEMQKL